MHYNLETRNLPQTIIVPSKSIIAAYLVQTQRVVFTEANQRVCFLRINLVLRNAMYHFENEKKVPSLQLDGSST